MFATRDLFGCKKLTFSVRSPNALGETYLWLLGKVSWFYTLLFNLECLFEMQNECI